jgi:hypothetical protein
MVSERWSDSRPSLTFRRAKNKKKLFRLIILNGRVLPVYLVTMTVPVVSGWNTVL